MRDALDGALKTFLVLTALFLVHRGLAFEALAGGRSFGGAELAGIVLTGVASDLWVAWCVAFLALLAGLAGRHAWLVFAGIFTIATVGHQAYVAFFKFQIIPFHFKYLLDPDFVGANGGAVINGAGVCIVAVGAALATLLAVKAPFETWSTKRLAGIFVSLMLACGVLHNRNIHWRVQWFVPEHLQVHALEKLHLNLKSFRAPDPLTVEERSELARMLQARPDDPFELLTTRSLNDHEVHPLGPLLQKKFAERRAAGKKPVALVILLESLRPVETGYFTPEKKPSLTPTLDGLAATGVTFMRAVSTGSVTRGAQEAAFCGYLGSRDTSMMRAGALRRFDCLPEKAKGAEVFWFHGGEGRFDGQLAFWRERGVALQMSLQDFDAATARTGWGVGDRAFFARAAEQLSALRRESTKEFALGLMLSVTNHIPWDLPADAFNAAAKLGEGEHPSHQTTAYTDAALGEFLDGMKRDGSWADAFLVIASDHGNNVVPRVDLYAGREDRAAWLQSHVNLLLGGGIVDEALADLGGGALRFEHLVGQADVAALMAYVTGMDVRVFGENPLRATRSLPVVSDLEEGLFVPAEQRLYPRVQTLTAPGKNVGAEGRRALLYYRAFLELIVSQP